MVILMGLLDTARARLDELGINYETRGDIISMTWETDHFDNLVVNIMVSPNDVWLYIIAQFTSFFEIADESKRLQFAYEMHKKNFERNGVKFGIDPNDNIVVLTETNDTDLTADELRQFISSVLNACDILYELYPS